jgi:hypothetical protein
MGEPTQRVTWSGVARSFGATVGIVAAIGLMPSASKAQDSSAEEESRAIVPGQEYAAGWFHRALFGTHYRDLWTAPIEVPVLDLATYEGGLTPLRRGGFGQTTSLHLTSGDARRFVFRSVNKDPSAGLPSLLRGTFVDDIVQDQISALHPDAALVVSPLLEAVGVLHAVPRLFVMPDDPALGEFRAEFAGMLAMLEERPDEAEDDRPGFAESKKIVGTVRLFDRLEGSPKHRVDAKDFLAARLMDLFLGDRDRHADQWRWARFPDGDDAFKWRPIPRDRDQAFFALGGFFTWLSRFWTPQFVAFGDGYPNLVWATWNGRGLDRRLLVDLEKSAWDSVVVEVEGKLTDSVIEAAVRRMPAAHYALAGPELERLLTLRRDKLRELANDYYHLLAEHVDIHATDKDEIAHVTRLDEDVEVRVYRARKDEDISEEDRYLRRLFHRDETSEIRLFLHGGDDRVVVRGDVEQSIVLHIVGGGGDDVLIDSSSVRGARRQTRFYDSRGDNEFVAGSRTTVDQRELTRDVETERFAAPEPTGPFGLHSRNWGQWWRPVIWTGWEPDVGLFLGGGTAVYTYGFRKVPYKYRLTVRGGYAFGAGRARVEVRLESPSLAHKLEGAIVAGGSGIEVVNFFGFGNETPESDDDFVRVRQEQYILEPRLTLRLMGRAGRGAIMGGEASDTAPVPTLTLTVGPLVKVARTQLDSTRLIGQLQPPGVDTFGQVGMSMGLQYDSRDRLIAATRGVFFHTGGELYPPLLTVASTYGKLKGELRTYLTPGAGDRAPTLALRVGGERVWGDFPFFEAAFLGGSSTVRGFSNQRFAGDGAVYGGGEIRLPVGRTAIIVPGEFGVLGFADAGRVFFSGEDSNRWHVGGGGGIWFSLLERTNTMSLGLATSAERIAFYAGAGFSF